MAGAGGGGAELDYDAARRLLAQTFAEAEAALDPPPVPSRVVEAADRLFASSVQSYREALLGCAIARRLDPGINVRLPYAGHGPGAFNGRTLDERVVNPFLKDQQVPSSKGPYLASFRRSIRFVPETGQGLRDKAGYGAMLDYLAALEAAAGAELDALLLYLCIRFVRLRDQSRVPLVRLIRMTLDQQATIIAYLLATPSGGRLPVLLAAAMFETLRDRFGLPWDVQVQGINTADAATGAGGDIVVQDTAQGATLGQVVMAVEVTERPIDRGRVVATFGSKIATSGIADYLFLHTAAEPTSDAREAAFSFFAQGHDISFLRVDEWLRNCLGTVGAQGRELFTQLLLARLDGPDVPASLKRRWNELAQNVQTLTPPLTPPRTP